MVLVMWYLIIRLLRPWVYYQVGTLRDMSLDVANAADNRSLTHSHDVGWTIPAAVSWLFRSLLSLSIVMLDRRHKSSAEHSLCLTLRLLSVDSNSHVKQGR